MDVLMPDGTTITGVPEGITQSDLLARYNKFSTMQAAPKAAPAQPTPNAMTGDEYLAQVAKRNEQQPERTIGGTALDTGITLLKGAIGLPEAFVGLADIPTLGYAGKLLEQAGYKPKEAKEILDTYLSEAQQAANRRVKETEGFLPTIGAAIQNPSTIATSVGESLPQMLGGAGIAKGLLKAAPAVAPYLAAAAGEGLLGAGASAEQMRQEAKDKLLTGKQALSAVGSGVGTAAFSVAGGKLAKKFGLDDIDTMLVGGAGPSGSKSVLDFAKRATASGISEGVFEEMPQSAQEQMWMNYATDKPLLQGVPEAAGMGAVTGAAMGVGATALAGRRKQAGPTEKPPGAPEDLDTFLKEYEERAAERKKRIGELEAETAGLAPQPPAPPAPPAATETAPPSASQDTEAMLQELIEPTIAPAIVEPTPTLQEEAVAEEKPTKAPAAEAPVEAPKEEAPAEPTLKEQYDKAAKLNFMASDAFRNKLIDQDQLDKIRSDYERIKAEYQASIPKGELSPIQQEATDIADKLEALGLKPFADGMRTSIEKNQVGEQNLEFYRTKLKQEQAKAPKAEAGVERPSEKWNWADFYSDDTKGLEKLKLFNSKAKPEVKEALQTVSDSIQAVTDRLNDEGYTMYGPADLNVPKDIKDLRSQIQTLSATGSLLINKFEALNKGFNRSKKTTNQENLDKAIANAKASAADAQKSLQRSIPEPEEVVKARQAVGEVSTMARKMETSSKSLWGSLINRLHPEEVREIFGNNPSLGEKKLQVTKKSGLRGSYLTDLVADGALDAYLPPANRHDSARFDEAEAAQYIKDAIANKDYLPYDVKREIEMAFASVSEAEALINEYLTIEEQNRELQVAADEQRETAQEAEVVEPEGEGRPAPADEGQALELTAPTADELKAKQDEIDRLEKENKRLTKEAEAKAKADEQAKEFVLTGSEREADQAAARGQKDIFAEAPKEDQGPQFLSIEPQSLSDAMINGIEEENKRRSPSLIRTLKTYNRQLKDGRMSEEMYIMMSDAAIREDERNRLNKEIKDRERGADWIREKLLNAKRKGFLSEKAVDMAEWFIGQNPDLVYDLGISIRGKGEAGVGGFYNSLSRVINLIKEGSSDATTVHEILHHLERMMPAKVQDAIRKAWATQLVKAQKAAKTPAEKLYFAALVDAHYGDNDLTRLNVPEGAGKAYSDARMALMDMRAGTSSAKLAEILLKMDVVPKELYQYFNASEFWAVNASRIVESRYDAVKAGNLARLKTWLREFGQKIKSLFGMKSDAAVLRALNSLSKATGEFQSDKMLGEGEYLNISARRNYEGNQPPAAKFESPEESKMDTLIYKLQDKLIDTKRVMQAIEKTSGEIAENWNVYQKEETYHGRLAKRTEDFLDDELMPIFKEMKEKGVSLDDLETYLHNRHAEEANKYIAKINPERPDGGSGVMTADAQAYLESLTPEQRANYDSLATKIDKIIKGTQKLLVDTGLEKKEVIDNWNKAYEHYVPLERDNLDFVQSGRGVMGGFSTRGGASKRRVGSEKEVINIFANIALQRERALRRSEQARVGRALYGMAIKYPNPDFWLPINPDAIKDKEKLIAELKSMGLSDADAENIIQEPKEPQFDKKTGLVRYQVNPLLRNSPNVFPVRINGEDRFIIFNPNDPRAKRMVESLKNLDAEQLGAVLGTVGMATRWIASVNTQYNPVFGAWNFARDVQGAALNLSTTELAGKEKEVLKATWPALFAVYRDLRGKEGKTKESKEWIDMFERYQLAGGQTGYQNQFSETKKKANIVERELAKLDHSTARKAAESVFKWLSDYNDAMENSVRLAAFKVAVTPKADGGLGMSDDAAASLAKNLTVNFNRKGASSPILQSLYAFFNAAVQGNARLLKTLRGPAGKKIIVGGMTLGAFQAIALAMAGFDDDEPPDFVKDKNIVIPIGDGKYLTIPMPLGFNVFPGLGRLAMEAMLIGTGDLKSRKGAASKFGSAASLIVDSFNPLGSGSVQQMLTPTVADPLMALYANRDAFGRPISKEDRATAPTPGYERSRENASFFSQKLAEALNWLTSPPGTKHTKGWASPTADQIDYFIGQYTGGVGREIMKAGETAKSFVTKEEQPIYRVPVLGKLYGETGTPAAISSKFYGNVTAMAEHEHEVKQRQKARESISEYYKENPEARLWQRANYIENQITRLNKEKKALRERGAPDEQIKRKEDQKIQLMKAFNDQVSKAQ